MQRHQLIVGYAVGRGSGTGVLRTDRPGLLAHVDHHDLIAETVHLREGMVSKHAHVGPSCRRVIWENRLGWANRVLRRAPAGEAPKGPISLTLLASAAISIPRKSARADLPFYAAASVRARWMRDSWGSACCRGD